MHDDLPARDAGSVILRSDDLVIPVGSAGGTRPKARPMLVCFSHLRWDFVWQRPQHLLVRAARTYRVVFVEEPIFGPEPVARLDVTLRAPDIDVLVPVLPNGLADPDIAAAQRDLLDAYLDRQSDRIAVLWYYTPMAAVFTGHLSAGLVVYDNMDELSAFRGASPEILVNESAILARADVVFTGGMSLYEAKKSRHRNVRPFPSSIDIHHFATARVRRDPDPADQASIPHPRLGFFGVIDERMDVDLVRRVAAQRPDWHLVMIGPVVKIDPTTLPRQPNIHWLGPKTYAELPDYLAGWDAGLMPFALNESTRFISPTKTPEYLAAGIPVVSTRVADVVTSYGQCGLVEIADTADEVIAKLGMLLARPKGGWMEDVDRHLAPMSWDHTWSAMTEALAEATSRCGWRTRPDPSASPT